MSSEVEDFILRGSEFQSNGAALEKALSPYVFNLVDGTLRVSVLAERRSRGGV